MGLFGVVDVVLPKNEKNDTLKKSLNHKLLQQNHLQQPRIFMFHFSRACTTSPKAGRQNEKWEGVIVVSGCGAMVKKNALLNLYHFFSFCLGTEKALTLALSHLMGEESLARSFLV